MRTFIVIPCFNEALRLDTNAIRAFLAAHEDRVLVLVDDGSTDGTLALLKELERDGDGRVTVIAQPRNSGKAEAVRVGVLHALSRGAEYVGYWDADLATPLEAVDAFVDLLRNHPETEIVLGARVALLGRRIVRKPMRHYLGRVFASVASAVLALPVYDTQCGAKLLRVTSRTPSYFAEPFDSRWIFDVELLARHLVSGGSPGAIYELPLEEWHDVGKSKVRPSDFVRAVSEMAAIHRKYRIAR